MSRLAIADPPYPPMFSVRRDLAAGGERLTSRSRATRYYGVHPDAAVWDNLDQHRQLLAQLLDEFDGWAIATTPDGLGAYHPLPVACRVMAWARPRAMPGAGRLHSMWEPVIVYTPEGRRSRAGGRVPDLLVEAVPSTGFVGAKPARWTRWVLDALGHDPETDTVTDLFPGSGAVGHEAAQFVLPISGTTDRTEQGE
jgi:hypothetical protein